MEKNRIDPPINRYVDYINAHVLPFIDYDRLQADYATGEKVYGKSVLNALHRGMLEVYGTDTFDENTAGGYVLLPGVVESKNGNFCVALLELDLQSSGEHCATDFLIGQGCINQFEDMPDKLRRYLSETYPSYEYGYTATVENDIHTIPDRLSPCARGFLEHFAEYEFVPVDPKRSLQSTELEPDGEEDMER